ncbi:tellurite resistance/C4-dicarboxylate transporter family protein [Streptomyces sp. NPDC048604]|uniref:tellurite resistance/C4-dicarboxylate transporter family protein n=1 Tax=Streptomyces sp. NPDC048604 TaxID=3365578 RepID=UPI0037134596
MNEGAVSGREPWWSRLPPVAGAAVMASAILSVGLQPAGFEVLSVVALCLAGALWLLLAAAFATLAVRDRGQWSARADTPPALTAVAATTVLGVRLALLGWTAAATLLLVLAAAVWPFLLTGVLRHLRRGAPGAVFLVCVATEGLAVLAAVLAPDLGDWPAWTGLVLFVLGLALYVDALVHFDLRQVLTGSGDHWVAGGSPAISALAASKLAASGVWSGAARTALETTAFVLLGLSLAWYAVLLPAEALRRRPAYDIRRWATVFPLGMTAVAALSTSAATGVAWLDTLGRILLWIAVAGWLITLVALFRSRRRTAGARATSAL